MSKELVIPSKFTMADRFSSPFKKMMDSTKQQVEQLKGDMSKFNSFIKNNADSFKKMGRNATVAGGVILGTLGLAANQAINFEDKMADVAKVMNLDFGSEQFNKIGDEVKELSTYLAVAPEDAAALYASLAQGGAPAESLGEIAKMAGEIGVAFGISSEEAGTSFIKLRNAMGLTIEDTKKVTDSINHLGNSTAAASDELLEFMASGGAGAARNLNLLGQEAAAFGSVLISNGKSASEAGTIFERMMKGIMSNKDMKKMFDQAGGGMEGLMSIFEKASTMDADKQFKFFSSFGAYGTDISMFAKNYGELQKSMALVSDESNFYNSSLAEFDNRQKTTAVQLQKMKAEFSILAIEIGQAVLPILRDLMQEVSPMIKSFIQWTKNNKPLVAGMVKFAAVTGATLAVVGPLLYAVGSAHKVFSSVSKALAIAKVAMSAFGASTTLALGPIGLVVAGIAALAVGYKVFSMATRKAATSEQLMVDVKKRALEATIDQRVEAMMLFNTMKKSKEGTDAYNDSLRKLEELQPGIIEKYRDKNGAIKDAIGLEKEYMDTMLKRAWEEVRMEQTKEKMKEALRREQEGPGLWDKVTSVFTTKEGALAALAMTNPFTASLGPWVMGGLGYATSDLWNEGGQKVVNKDVDRLKLEAERSAALVNPYDTSQTDTGFISSLFGDILNPKPSEVVIKIDNGGAIQDVSLTGGESFLMSVIPNVGSTVK